MRIISAYIAILIAMFLISSRAAQADELTESNETKINFKIEGNGNMNSRIMLADNSNILLAYNPNNFKNTVAVPEAETKRELSLTRFKSTEKTKNLPKGKFTINASAYTASADECGKSDGITASGLKVKEQETLACPPQFPFGTKIQIEGMGTYICEDRGGAIKVNHIDIYMETKAQAFSFGRQNLVAEIVG